LEEVVLRADEVMTRSVSSGQVDATREVFILNIDSTSEAVVSLDLVGSGVYTITSPTPTTRTVVFDSTVPIGTKYSIAIVR
jgi:UDP-glucose 6-dehydrogenase